MSNRILCLSFAVLLATLLPSATMAACDPSGADLDRAQAAIDAQKFDAALPIVNRVLARDANDFRANYQMGLIVVDQADIADKPTPQPNSRFAEGLALMEKTANQLPQLDQACAKQKNFYAILNTIGAELLNRGRFKEAETYLLKAKTASDSGLLSPPSTTKVLDNLGLVYLWQQNLDLSTKYYRAAQTQGSKVATFQLGTVQKLQVLTPVVKKPVVMVRTTKP
jgi:tetratricopeptide (TPR) repeat protein